MLFWPLTHWVDLEKPLFGDPVQLSNLRMVLLLNAGWSTISVPVTPINFTICEGSWEKGPIWLECENSIFVVFHPRKHNFHIPAIGPFSQAPSHIHTKCITLGTKLLCLIIVATT